MKNVRIIAVGLGRYINGKQLDDIVNRPIYDNIYSSGHSYLHLMTDRIVKNICLGIITNKQSDRQIDIFKLYTTTTTTTNILIDLKIY